MPGIIKYRGCTLRRMAWAQDRVGETTTWRSIEKPQQEMETVRRRAIWKTDIETAREAKATWIEMGRMRADNRNK